MCLVFAPAPPAMPPYLVPAGQAASPLIPGDGVGGLAGHQAVEVQDMSIGQGGRGRLDADGVHHTLGWEGETGAGCGSC